MDVGRFLVEAHLRDGRSVAELARSHGVHRSWLYKLLARHRLGGDAALAPRSRRPHRSPSAMRPEAEAQVVRLRTELLAQGLDAGALTIQWHLRRARGSAPSASSSATSLGKYWAPQAVALDGLRAPREHWR